MKRKLILFLAVLMVVSFVGVLSAMASSKFSRNDNRVFLKYGEMNGNELQESLRKLNKKELIKDVNELSKDVNQTDFTPIAIEVISRIDEFSYDDLLSEITNGDNTENFQALMVDAYLYKSNTSNERTSRSGALKGLLKESKVDRSTKAKIILDSDMNESDVPMLVEFAGNDDDAIVSSSLKRLSLIDPNIAYEQGRVMLENRRSISDGKIAAAQKSMVRALRDNKINKDNVEFIKTGIEIFEESTSEALKDSSIFSLAEIRDIDAFMSIMNREDVDFELKVYAIDFNYQILEDLLLQDDLTYEEINLVINSMELHPILDLKDKIIELKNRSNEQSVVDALNAVISNINDNGVSALRK